MTTSMNEAGLRHLELRYLTLHSVDDILNDYTGIDPVSEMAKYFCHIQPLLTAIRDRALEFGIRDVISTGGSDPKLASSA